MTASTTAAVEALTAAQNAFADLPMPPAHGAPRPSTLADLAALHFDALARLLDHYAEWVDRLPAVEIPGEWVDRADVAEATIPRGPWVDR